jgi:geranylgeranyl pyrophosphate synthase
MCRGEIINLSEHDFDTYKSIIADKTASLMSFCCKAGAESVRQADDSPAVVDALEQFGFHYGMMFQITDDLEDHDSDIAIANKDKTLALLNEHIHAADVALGLVPDSIYKAGLSSLWRDVVLRAEKLSSSNETSQRGQGLPQIATSGGMSETKA